MSVAEDRENLLRKRLSGHPNKALTMAIAAEALADDAVLDMLFRLLYHGDAPLRWRAAWVLEKVGISHPLLVAGERRGLIRQLMQPGTPDGLSRLLLSILYHLPDEEILDVPFFNFLLDKMGDLQSPPGVQALAMKLACRMSRKAPDLHQEFLYIVRDMELDYYSAGVRAVARNCLKCG